VGRCLCTAEVQISARLVCEGAGEGAEIWNSHFSRVFATANVIAAIVPTHQMDSSWCLFQMRLFPILVSIMPIPKPATVHNGRFIPYSVRVPFHFLVFVFFRPAATILINSSSVKSLASHFPDSLAWVPAT
jgi:hypothetical protein